MKKRLLIIFGIVLLGLLAWFLSYYFRNERVSESLDQIPAMVSEVETSQAVQIETVRAGNFVNGAPGHFGEGNAKLIKNGEQYFIRFEDDFKVTNGPDLYVYLGSEEEYDPNAQVAKLKGNQGGQNYEVPGSLDPTQHTTVWIWCKTFSVPFAKADLI